MASWRDHSIAGAALTAPPAPHKSGLKIGDKFTVGGPDKPGWTDGEWTVTAIAPKKIQCVHSGGRVAWLQTDGVTHG